MIDFATITKDDLEALAQLDAAGLPIAPQESLESYKNRLEAKRKVVEELNIQLQEAGEATVFEWITISAKDRIPTEIMGEAEAITSSMYDFSTESVPGFFLSQKVGLLWGGCLICDTEEPLSIILLRSAFRNSKRFFIYGRQELLAHELCHSFRQELHDTYLEEFFAYQTSPSLIRRHLGNAFIRDIDALLFVIPALILLASQIVKMSYLPALPIWPFWGLAIGVPMWLLIRCFYNQMPYFKALKLLTTNGIAKGRSILFRATAEERKELSSLKSRQELEDFFRQRSDDLRWQVIKYRFLEDF